MLALVPPTPRNLATYCAWAASARFAGVFLPAHCEGVLRVELGPGDTLVLPGGWAHAAATTSAAVLLGGCFLRRDALALQLEAWRIEVGGWVGGWVGGAGGWLTGCALTGPGSRPRPTWRRPCSRHGAATTPHLRILFHAALASTRYRPPHRPPSLAPQDHLAVRPRFRYPAFKQVHWYAAAAAARRLQRLAGLPGGELRERAQAQLAAMAQEAAAAAATRGQGASGDSDSVSKAGAAKLRKGWAAGAELADDAATRQQHAQPPRQQQQQQQQQQERQGTPRAAVLAAAMGAQRPQQLARAAASPTAAAQPRLIGRAVGGGSRLRKAGGAGGVGGGGGGGAARSRATRLNPTQPGLDFRGGGGRAGGGSGGGGGGGGFARRKRQRSPDSFIEQDSEGEEVRWQGFPGCAGTLRPSLPPPPRTPVLLADAAPAALSASAAHPAGWRRQRGGR